MPGTFNGKTLEITAAPTPRAKLPDVTVANDADITNVAGITILSSGLYCAKTSGTKTAILKINDYTNKNSSYSIIGNLKTSYFSLGLSKIGDILYMLAETKKGYGGTTRIVKLTTSGTKKGEIEINGIFPDGAIGIAYTGKDEEFFILGYGNNNTPTIKRISLGNSTATVLETFTIQNSGYGYTYQLQDIYYHLDYGLFLLTNDNLKSGRNKILMIDYKKGNTSYIPNAVITVNLSQAEYIQYNLESICMKSGKLILASNIQLANGTYEDRVSTLEGITFGNGTYSFNAALTQGMKVSNKKIGNLTATNFGAIAFDKYNKLYGIKAGAGKAGYISNKDCIASLFTLDNYNSASGTKNDIYDIEPGEIGCLYHANGMDYYNENLYIACGEVESIGTNSFVRMSMDGLKVKRFFSGNDRANAISKFNGSQFIAYTDTNMETDSKTNLPVYRLLIGTFNDANNTYTVSQTYHFLNTGCGTIQDIFYREKYGLFIVTCDIKKILATDEYQTSKNTVLHLDLSRTRNLTLTNNINRSVIIPDFAFDNKTNINKFFSFELESLALDTETKNLVVAVNAANAAPNLSNKHPGEDYLYRYSSVTFI